MCQLFGLAYGRSASVSCAVNWFQKCEIFPANRLVFDDADFDTAEITDQQNSEETISPVGVVATTSLSVDNSFNLPCSSDSPFILTILPSSSNLGSSVTLDTSAQGCGSGYFVNRFRFH